MTVAAPASGSARVRSDGPRRRCAPPRAGRRQPLGPAHDIGAVCAPAGGAAVGRDVQDVVPESRRVPAVAAAGRDARDIVGGDGPGDDVGERGERSGHADRDDDAQ